MVEHNSQVELTIDLVAEEDQTDFRSVLPSLPLEAVVAQTLRLAGITQPAILALLITSDEAMRKLNQQYRGQDKPTDVLSFPLLDKPIVKAPSDQLWMLPEGLHSKEIRQQAFVTPAELTMHLGDIVISWPTVVRQAAEAGHTSAYELLYLLSHGVLHLIGYDDQTESGYQAMVLIQQAVMKATQQET